MSSVETEAITVLDEYAELISETLAPVDYSEVVSELEILNDNVTRSNEIGEYIYTTLVYIMVMLLIWGVIKIFDSFIKL